ncbi:ACP S-malonyltransferase [Streptomyces sp. NPDC013161]|uniref:ACP S-malonyltransferase n=1 Tax=Streptomyces sp. NPDC013161 TaxID=3364862 RepID=UPI0036785A02
MTEIWMFPGQGGQRVGMGAHWWDAAPELVEAADAVLGYSVRDLCENGPQERLDDTRYAQPALYVVGAAAWRAALASGAPAPDVVCGHSLGEYNALECAGAMDFADGLRLVRRRAEAMAAVTGSGMLAVLGLGWDRLGPLLDPERHGDVSLAVTNGPRQLVVGGPTPQLRSLATELTDRRICEARPLRVSGAFHTPLMAPAAREFAPAAAGLAWAEPAIPVPANVTARPHDRRQLPDLLVRHLTHPVLWHSTVESLLGLPAPHFREIGGGTALTGMVRAARLAATPSN